MRQRKDFDTIRAAVREVVLAHTRGDITIDKAEIIADDCAYLIWRGQTSEEAQKSLTDKAAELSAQVSELRKVSYAASQLYFAGCWRLKKPTPAVNERQMWEDLRDALGLKPGSATQAKVGDV